MRLAATGTTDVGLRRERNEDAFLLLPEGGLFAVADGLGGHASGEVASRLAVESLRDAFSAVHGDAATRLREAVLAANRTVHARSAADPRLSGMGTTLVAAAFPERGPVAVAHVGDSRAYLFREGRLVRLTEDHTLLSEFIREASPTEEEIAAYPHKHVVVRALGMRDAVEVDVALVDVREGDLLLLCCDGLCGMVPDDGMAAILREEGADVLRANQLLVDAAIDAGGADNVTSVLVEVVERPGG
jgi:PPM family protein phosphatase